MPDSESVNCDRSPTVSFTKKSATALVLAALLSIGAASVSQAADLTPMTGGATGCCRMLLN